MGLGLKEDVAGSADLSHLLQAWPDPCRIAGGQSRTQCVDRLHGISIFPLGHHAGQFLVLGFECFVVRLNPVCVLLLKVDDDPFKWSRKCKHLKEVYRTLCLGRKVLVQGNGWGPCYLPENAILLQQRSSLLLDLGYPSLKLVYPGLKLAAG